MTADRAPEGLDWARLREVAEAATPGPWRPCTTGVECGDHWSVIEYPAMNVVARIPSNDGENEDVARSSLASVAATSPDRILALLDALAEQGAHQPTVTHLNAFISNASAALRPDPSAQGAGEVERRG